MPSFETLLTFTLAALLMNLSPGPSNFYVIARTLEKGVAGGLAAVAGLAVGGLLHVLAAVLGLSALITYSPFVYGMIKLTGAAYLLYLGLSALRRAMSGESEVPGVPSGNPGSSIFRQSVLVEVTNPKTALFFIALLPQFIDPQAGSAAPQFLLLGLIVTVSAIPCDLLVTFFAGKAAAWFRGNPSALRWQDSLSGLILTALGVYVLLDGVGGDGVVS